MTSSLVWPWLKDSAVAVAGWADPPINPVHDTDDRPSVKELVEKHRKNIDAVAKELRDDPLFDSDHKHDDLWVLRFLLSNKNKVKPAAKAAQATLAFRKEYKLDENDIRAFPPATPIAKDEAHKRYAKHIEEGCLPCHVPDPQLGPVYFLVFSGWNQSDMVKHVDEQDWKSAFVYISEWAFQWTDYITRTTGRLTKNVRLVDAEGMKLSEINMEANRRDGKAMGSMDQMYPQMLEGAFRKEYKLDENDIRAFPPFTPIAKIEAHKRLMKHIEEGCFGCHVPDPQLGPIFFLVFSGFHQNDMVKFVDEQDWKPAIVYVSEWCFQWTDYITRTTGRLTKNVRFVDAEGMKLSEINMECNRRDGKVMGSMDQMYPQMLEGIKIINSPSWIQIPWKVIRTIMPKRVVSKIDFIEPSKKESEKQKLLKYISEEDLPNRFGGKYTTWPPQYDEIK
eukprot:CAMPEP_0194228054 /NCGR_PEP_ID=MMETSP0156-20130528/43175_1 /TAXON_ID=33649 /ORGANISM="Thalassionema nitzschioides, Strain L26-B" /LENGTH=448 /DNA_ID=CAMNT_0038960555 /DNA_START=86 /DNA_END=1432 /DNA_ORIENTATION=+